MGLLLILAIAIILVVFIGAAFLAYSGNEQQRELLECTKISPGSDLKEECFSKYYEKYGK